MRLITQMRVDDFQIARELLRVGFINHEEFSKRVEYWSVRLTMIVRYTDRINTWTRFIIKTTSRTNISDQQRTLGALLRRPYELLQTTVYDALAGHGHPNIRAAHSAVLRHIDDQGSRMTVLAERAGMTKQSMSYLVESLQGLGYVTTTDDPDDRRANRITLTATGRQLHRLLVKLSAEYERQLTERVGPEVMNQLRSSLTVLYEALEPAN